MSGTLAITPRPRGGDWLDDEVAALARHGVHVLVSLLREDEERELGLERETQSCMAHGIELVSIPVEDRGVPVDGRAFVQSAQELAARLRGGTNVAIHCRQSVGRSGLLAVSIGVACGLTLDSAIQLVSDARGLPVPETPGQYRWLRQNLAHVE